MTQVKTEPATEAAKRAVILTEPRIKGAEYERNTWVVNAEQGTTVSDVLEPLYLSCVSQRLSPYDRIEVRIDTGEWMLELLVLGCGRNFAKVCLLHKHELEPTEFELPAAQKHKIEWKGPQHKWCVIRLADGEMLFRGMDKGEAAAALERHERATG